MKLKDIKALKAKAEKLPQGTIEYYKAMIHYHDEASIYWDNLVGSSLTHDDETCTKKWKKHCKAQDKFFNILRKIGGLQR